MSDSRGQPEPSRKSSSFFFELSELIPNLNSPDCSTRWVSFLFFVFLFGFLTLGWFAVDHFALVQRSLKARLAHQSIANFTKLLQTVQHQPLDSIGNLISLGSFFIHVLPSHQKQTQRALRLAEVEIVLLCDSPETRDLVERLDVPIRDQVTRVLLPTEREELLSGTDRNRIKKDIIEILNKWLPQGQIKEVYFSKLVLD